MKVKSIEDLLLEIYLKLPYIEGISEVRGVDRRGAIKLAQKYKALRTGSDVKDVFRTLDSKKLLREILKLVTSFCRSEVTKDRVLVMAPYSNPEALRVRIDFMEQFFKFADSNQPLVKEAGEILRGSSIGKVRRALDPLVVVGNEELRSMVTCSARKLRVQILPKKGLVESLKREQLVICTGFGEVRGAISLPESFELFDVIPDRFVSIFESFKKVLEAYVKVSKLLEGSQLGSLFKHGEDATKISDLVGSLKLDPLDPSKSLEGAEIKISEGIDRIKRLGGGLEKFRSIVQEAVESLGLQLGLDEKSMQALVKDALENARSPFSFSTYLTKRLIEEFRRKALESSYREYRRVAFELSKYVEDLAQIAEELYEFDLMLAIYEFSKVYSLRFPRIIEEGVGFIGGRNITLLEDELRGGLRVQRVDYSIGKTGLEIFGATTRNIVLLTGANSGGKTTLLMTVAQIATMSLLGLPVPAEEAEVSLSSIYLYRRRTVKKTGSLEHALRSTIHILSKRERKLVLMDEFEALTEPKAIARIMAAFLNNMPKHSLALFVTHLTGDIIPYLRSEYRVDGIEATGIPARRVLGYGLNMTNPSDLLNKDIREYSHSWTEVWIPDYGWLTVDPKILNQLRSEEIEALKRVFEEHDVGIAYLFGSRVKGTSREDSDFDVAALFEKDVTVMDEIRLAMDIVSALNVSSEKVDVVSLNKADDTLKARVLREGIPVYARSEKSRKEWERQTYLEVLNYMDLLAIYKISRENNTLH